jgi:hypothetical protein
MAAPRRPTLNRCVIPTGVRNTTLASMAGA